VYVVFIRKSSSANALGASVVWHITLPMINKFNKTETAIFSMNTMLRYDSIFSQINLGLPISYQLLKLRW